MIYYTIQKGYEIFGTGTTAEESLADAKEWIDKDNEIQDFNVEDLQFYNQADDGEFCIVTKEEYDNGQV